MFTLCLQWYDSSDEIRRATLHVLLSA